MNIGQLNKRPLAVVLMLALAAGIATIAASSHADSSAVADAPADAPVPGFMYPPAGSDAAAAEGHAAFAQRFGLLRTAPRVVLASMVIKDPGIDREAAREVAVASAEALAHVGAAAPEARIWVAPRYDGTVCLLPLLKGADGPAETCASADDAAHGRLVMTQSRSDADVDVYGLVPDGVEQVTVRLADGSTSVLPVVGNAYAAHFTQPTASIAFGDGDAAQELTLRSDG